MAGKQAKVLSLGDVNDLLVFASCTRHPLRNHVIVLLAAKAGLRAVEIAQLTWDMVLDPTGDVGSVIELRDIAAKNGSGRLIPVHPDLRQSLVADADSFDRRRTCHSIRARRPHDATEHRGLVQPGIPQHWSARLLVTLRTPKRSSPGPHGSFIRPVVRCAMSNCSLVTGRSKQHNDTSTATAMCSASWSQ